MLGWPPRGIKHQIPWLAPYCYQIYRQSFISYVCRKITRPAEYPTRSLTKALEYEVWGAIQLHLALAWGDTGWHPTAGWYATASFTTKAGTLLPSHEYTDRHHHMLSGRRCTRLATDDNGEFAILKIGQWC